MAERFGVSGTLITWRLGGTLRTRQTLLGPLQMASKGARYSEARHLGPTPHPIRLPVPALSASCARPWGWGLSPPLSPSQPCIYLQTWVLREPTSHLHFTHTLTPHFHLHTEHPSFLY